MAPERLFNKGSEVGLSRERASKAVFNSTKGELVAGSRPAGFEPLGEPDVRRATAAVRRLVKSTQTLQRAATAPERRISADEMRAHTAEIITALQNTRLGIFAVLAKSLAKLLTVLCRDPDAINPSTLRSITRAIDLVAGTLTRPGLNLPKGRAYRILVVDDDQVCRRALSMALFAEQLKIEVCESGSTALEILRNEKFDAVFTDIMMPDLDGFGMVKKMRDLPGHDCTPVVYVTALDDYQTRVTSVLTGGCELIVKPFKPSEMAVKALTIGLQESIKRWENDLRGTPPAPSSASVDGSDDLICQLTKPCVRLETPLHRVDTEFKQAAGAL